MGYRSMVEKNVDKAFKLVGDLATSVTLVRKASSTFNFNTLGVKNVNLANLITLAIVTNITKNAEDRNVLRTSMMLKTKEIGDINLFDTVIINNETFKIGAPISTDGYVTTVEIFKEG